MPSPPLLALDEVLEISKQGGKFGRVTRSLERPVFNDVVFDSHFPEDP